MSSNTQRWRINIKNLETTLRIGIHPHERTPQRVMINATIEGDYPARPVTINDCFNYDQIHALVTQEWPKRPHVDLLETYVAELLAFIFKQDPRVTLARASVCKPDIFKEAEAVGVEAEWTRDEYNRLKP